MITSIQKLKLEIKNRDPRKGFTIRQVGIGDGIQFTSLPENYFKLTGEKLIDISKPWYLDHNPFIDRLTEPKEVTELWNYPKLYAWPELRPSVYMSNAEIHASVMGLKNPPLIRPRLYRYEDTLFEDRKTILFHPFGKSHGSLPDAVIDHVVKKYKPSGCLAQIGLPDEPNVVGVKIITPTLWDLVKEISRCKLFIGIDSGPAWIAACFPDVRVKKIRVKYQFGYCEPKDWVPLDVKNEHSFWDDQGLFQIFNCFERDIGFTQSFRKL